MKNQAKFEDRKTVGWREWVALPDLGVPAIKAKIDTGARTAALHAFDIRFFRKKSARKVSFSIHPLQLNNKNEIIVEALVLDFREIRSSSGHTSLRPVVETTLAIAKKEFPIEITLVNRDMMGFRLLLGREALRRQFFVDPQASFLWGLPVSL